MSDTQSPTAPLKDLKSDERSIVLSFLALSERPTPPDQSPMDELALSIALKSSLTSSAN